MRNLYRLDLSLILKSEMRDLTPEERLRVEVFMERLPQRPREKKPDWILRLMAEWDRLWFRSFIADPFDPGQAGEATPRARELKNIY